MSTQFDLITKFVVTHSAKSHCRFAIFHKIAWHSLPGLQHSRALVERRALRDLGVDDNDLLNVVTEQAAKLGANSKTNKAVQIFGNVGQTTQASQVAAADLPPSAGTKRKMRVYTLIGLYWRDFLKQILNGLGFMLDIAGMVTKSMASAVSANRIVIVLLAFSLAYNSWSSYKDGVAWYHERAAAKYMARLGVRSQDTISRAIYLEDVDDLVQLPRIENFTDVINDGVNCRSTFKDVLITVEAEDPRSISGGRQAQARLQRTRHRLAQYRHDLLVAMRVVNRVEAEVVQSEWEDWVMTESRRCDKMKATLKQRAGQDSRSARLQKGDMQELGDELETYCSSCREEIEALRSSG